MENKVSFDLHKALCTNQEKIHTYGFEKGKSYDFFFLGSIDNSVHYGVLNEENLLQIFSYDSFIEHFLPNEFNVDIALDTLIVSKLNEQDNISENRYK